MARIESLECVDRTTRILRSINAFDGISISNLARLSQIPRSVVDRYVTSLIDLELVMRDEATQRLIVTQKALSLSKGISFDDWRNVIARPVLVKACYKLGWPLSLNMIRGGSLVTLENTEAESPLVVDPTSKNMMESVIGSTSGQVLLAYQDPILRDQILRVALHNDSRLFSRARISFKQLLRQLADIRKKGFAIAKSTGVNWSKYSVPVFNKSTVDFCLTISFRRSALSHEEAFKRFHSALTSTANSLSQKLIGQVTADTY